ncbi:MAG: hypothetical protein OEZ59_02980 [Deltaproteobacteria bacterium]|nr:hypothetical protein [Deltaproteobacteria bacterium]
MARKEGKTAEKDSSSAGTKGGSQNKESGGNIPAAKKADASARTPAGGAIKGATLNDIPEIPHIKPKILKEIIAKLEEMQAESLRVVNSQRDPENRPWEDTVDVGDDLDQASNERDREFSLIMHQRHLRRLQQIEDAYDRIKDGSYGLCEGTDEPINPKRLLIMPLARYSLEYQEHQEKIMGRSVAEEGYSLDDGDFGGEE